MEPGRVFVLESLSQLLFTKLFIRISIDSKRAFSCYGSRNHEGSFILKVNGEKCKTAFCFEKLGSELYISYIQVYLLILNTVN